MHTYDDITDALKEGRLTDREVDILPKWARRRLTAARVNALHWERKSTAAAAAPSEQETDIFVKGRGIHSEDIGLPPGSTVVFRVEGGVDVEVAMSAMYLRGDEVPVVQVACPGGRAIVVRPYSDNVVYVEAEKY